GEQDAETLRALRDLGEMYFRAAELKRAQATFERIATLTQGNKEHVLYLADAYYLLARIAVAKTDWKSAAQHLEQSLRTRIELISPVDPTAVRIYCDLAMVQHQLGNVQRAHECLDLAGEINSKSNRADPHTEVLILSRRASLYEIAADVNNALPPLKK